MRFAFIDALRGIAAVSVSLFHIFPFAGMDDFPVVKHGWLGVPVFFVISGFVICYTLRDAVVTWRYAGNYALRRSIRLDPPYWTCILLMLSVRALLQSVLATPSDSLAFPGWKSLLSHAFYLQRFFGFSDISGGFWSLCIEVQFYLFMLLTAACFRRFPYATVTALFSLFSAATFGFDASTENPPHILWDDYASMFPMFTLFGLGITACLWVIGRTQAPFVICSTLMLAKLVWLPHPTQIVGLLTALAIVAVGTRPVGNNPILQGLGKISYSLYLMHWPVGYFCSLAGKRIGFDSVGRLVLSIVASLLVAIVVYLAVERPSVRLASQLKLSNT